MQRKWFTVLAVLLFTGLFMAACPADGISEWDREKSDSGTSTAVVPSKGNNNDQGNNEGNEKKPPVIVPPEENDNDGGDTETFWRASWGGALQGLPSDRYILDSIPSKIVITDTAMLHEFFADTYSLSLNEAGNDWVRDERFSDSIAKYDDTFFESRQLVTFFLTAGGGGLEFKLAGTTYTDGILNINIDYVSIGAGIAALIEWFAIVETNAVPAGAAVYVNVTDWLGRVYTF